MNVVRRARIGIGVVLAVATLAVTGASAAQEGEEPAPGDTTTTTTTDPSTSTTSTTSTTSSTVPSSSTTTTTTTAPTGPTTTIVDPAADGDSPPDTVPPEPVVVPPREAPARSETAAAIPEFALGRAVTVDLVRVREQAVEAIAAYDTAVLTRQTLEAQLAQLQGDVARLTSESARRVRELTDARADLRRTAVEAYLRGTSAPITGSILSSEHATDFYARQTLLGSVLEAAEEAADRYRRARNRVDDDQLVAATTAADVQVQLEAAKADEALAQVIADTARFELRVFSAGGSMAIHGFVFPVGEPHQFIDTFGAPRMTGTAYEHWHKGTDIFAAAGTPLYAVERGVVVRMGTDVLGGIKLWLKGESGTYYYYAHLSGFAPGVTEGAVVPAGTVVGFVGNTGNAATTPPHLHFEVHPGGGDAINPYPLLVVADEQQQDARSRLATGLTSG